MIKHYDKESDARFTKSQQMWLRVRNKGPVKHIHQLLNGYANNLCFMLAEKKKPQGHGSQKSNNIYSKINDLLAFKHKYVGTWNLELGDLSPNQ